MMRRFQSEQLLDLSPTETGHELYLFVDGRQLPPYSRVYFPDDPIIETAAVYLCEPDEKSSPYLLAVDHSVKHWFLRHQQGTEGFFFSSSWSLEKLAEHFRQQIQVLSPYGTTSYLNMAHADVAWTLLSASCHWFWQPMDKAWLPTSLGWQVMVRADFEPMVFFELPLQLTPMQWQQMSHIAWQSLLEAIYHHMRRHFPEVLFQQESGTLWIEAHAQIARQKGFVTRQDQLNYFNIIGWLGESAVTGESYPEIYQLIHFPSPDNSPTQRICQAARLARQYALNV
ncbi:hypothetical protein VR7878_02794 [Vibrio ruber DSM 16370]|uniref:DUF4123 domain-containing protein n=1 Tax=Vibrio ruber (strain DSM 16370 / JCM 11486 / BCRC 17186 / CECT 7878 / LMG 23124 / VR1) TaxID=1123498 RepID=A0A1R4LPZ6_VIBR1|nr:DUF4123 domain-containing protein [Vibrio ruber]SJN58354.1 hypothetical protein VR7878_02794 [Vibrio ruber DSM 16370]